MGYILLEKSLNSLFCFLSLFYLQKRSLLFFSAFVFNLSFFFINFGSSTYLIFDNHMTRYRFPLLREFQSCTFLFCPPCLLTFLSYYILSLVGDFPWLVFSLNHFFSFIYYATQHTFFYIQYFYFKYAGSTNSKHFTIY